MDNMYQSDFYWTWDNIDEELNAIFTVADALRDLRERNKSTRIFNSSLGISIFRDNSTRTRFSFASACNLPGLFPLLRKPLIRSSGRHRPEDPLRHGRSTGPSRGL